MERHELRFSNFGVAPQASALSPPVLAASAGLSLKTVYTRPITSQHWLRLNLALMCYGNKKALTDHSSIEERKSNYDVNKTDLYSKKEPKLESVISINPEYKFLFIKTEPQSKLTYKANLRNKPDGTRSHILQSDISKKKLFETQITKNSNNQYSCGQCTQSFRTLTDIKFHLESHLDSSFPCDRCPASFITLRRLNRHSLLTHSQKQDIKCNICQKKLKSNRNLRLHQLTHTGEKPFTCKQCGKRFTQNGSLQMHMKIHLGLKEHVCEYCNKAFTEYKNMKNHERTHTKERPFECRFCRKTFGDSSALIRHIRIHTGNKIYDCQQCHMKFSDPSGLTAHKKRHGGVKSYTCDFCDKKFTTQHILANHESSVHMKLKKFICEFCKKNFSLKQYLKNHILRIHMQNAQ
ncbi:hypothetical protein MSG28_003798 [Choristoneura fumiferana]|uniref:Uncharacterized protein n=1 Tax=Choristoneura fumiferana TaxID=7141 RepID=A0ACC0KH24_CHOFU|nr:hypothetical protein MSG28_003798 [Choristoneura fumiferana]